MNTLNVEYRKVEALIPYARNPRTHAESQIAKIAASIVEYGWTNPILVDGDNGIIAGHGRLAAARKLGLDEVPVIELAHLTVAQKRALVIADNRLALDAGWDEEMLALELADLSEAGYDLALTGFEDAEIEALLAGDVLGLSLSLDTDSWAWGFEATLPVMAESLVVPEEGAAPVELIATVNGTAFHVLAENLSRERVFGDASIRITGRGRSAALAAPYAPVMNFANTEPRSAQQLMEDVLNINGIPLGWTVDWALTDWLVPAGVFAKQGTWIEALNTIVGAAGGYLLPHPSEKILRVRHRYPVTPWHWWNEVTSEFVLPVDVVARESLRWIDKPAYNRVFVAGQEAGVLGQVTRTGTAGDVLAPMVVDALITQAAAARQRGMAILSDTGRQVEVSLRLPVLPETGIIEPGAFVAYQDGGVARMGIVRSTHIDAGLPEVWQTLGVQSHA